MSSKKHLPPPPPRIIALTKQINNETVSLHAKLHHPVYHFDRLPGGNSPTASPGGGKTTTTAMSSLSSPTSTGGPGNLASPNANGGRNSPPKAPWESVVTIPNWRVLLSDVYDEVDAEKRIIAAKYDLTSSSVGLLTTAGDAVGSAGGTTTAVTAPGGSKTGSTPAPPQADQTSHSVSHDGQEEDDGENGHDVAAA